WQSERCPGNQGPNETTAHQPEGKAYLAAGRPGQELTKRHQLGVMLIRDPAPAGDKFIPKITQMRHRAAERGEPELQISHQNLAPVSGPCLTRSYAFHEVSLSLKVRQHKRSR